MESAAVALSLSGRVPDKEVLWLPPDHRLPKSLNDWRAVRFDMPSNGVTVVNGLPIWTVESLVVGMALRPDSFKDWPNVGEWLPRATSQLDPARLIERLAVAPRSAWQRAGYLMAMGSSEAIGLLILDAAPPGRGPTYLGPRHVPGKSDQRFDLIDSVLSPGLSGVQP